MHTCIYTCIHALMYVSGKPRACPVPPIPVHAERSAWVLREHPSRVNPM